MIIKEEQIIDLGANSKLGFVEKTISFLRENVPDWAAFKEDDEISEHIENMIELGKDRNIIKEINIQKLLYYCLRFGLRIPFNKRVEELLAFDVLSEDERVKKLIKEIKTRHVR